MDIEDVAEKTPELIRKQAVDIHEGTEPFMAEVLNNDLECSFIL